MPPTNLQIVGNTTPCIKVCHNNVLQNVQHFHLDFKNISAQTDEMLVCYRFCACVLRGTGNFSYEHLQHVINSSNISRSSTSRSSSSSTSSSGSSSNSTRIVDNTT